jgi:hypothetical protein
MKLPEAIGNSDPRFVIPMQKVRIEVQYVLPRNARVTPTDDKMSSALDKWELRTANRGAQIARLSTMIRK